MLNSISRLAGKLRTNEQREHVECLSSAMGAYQASADLIELGVYEKGTQPLLDAMIELKPELDALLRQSPIAQRKAGVPWGEMRRLALRLKGAGHA